MGLARKRLTMVATHAGRLDDGVWGLSFRLVGGRMAVEIQCEDDRMTDEQLLERIVIDPKVMAGKPVIRGTRLTVDGILSLLAHGSTESDILGEYEGLTGQDIQACLLFATRALSDTDFLPLAG